MPYGLTPENEEKILSAMEHSTSRDALDVLRMYDGMLRRQARAFSMVPRQTVEEVLENFITSESSHETTE